MKKFDPFVLLTFDSGSVFDSDVNASGQHPGPNPGEGNGQNTVIGPVSFEDWRNNMGADLDLDGAITVEDYGQWWADNGFGMDAWTEFNADVPFTWFPESFEE